MVINMTRKELLELQNNPEILRAREKAKEALQSLKRLPAKQTYPNRHEHDSYAPGWLDGIAN